MYRWDLLLFKGVYGYVFSVLSSGIFGFVGFIPLVLLYEISFLFVTIQMVLIC